MLTKQTLTEETVGDHTVTGGIAAGDPVCGDAVSCRNAAPVLSFQVKGQTGEETASRLADMGFALRGGLHCSPLAHQKMGTLDRGTTRAGIGYFNTGEQVDALSNAVERIARNSR